MTQVRIRELAEQREMSIADVARDADVSYSTAHALWHDSYSMLDRAVLDRVALALGVRVADLFVGEPERKPRRPSRRRIVEKSSGNREPAPSTA